MREHIWLAGRYVDNVIMGDARGVAGGRNGWPGEHEALPDERNETSSST